MVVHLDYNVSSWPWFGQKSIVRVKTSFKKLSGGGWVVVVVVVHLDYNVSSWPWFGQKLIVGYVKVWLGSMPGQGA